MTFYAFNEPSVECLLVYSDEDIAREYFDTWCVAFAWMDDAMRIERYGGIPTFAHCIEDWCVDWGSWKLGSTRENVDTCK